MMAKQEKDEFLLCRNCLHWRQPWRLGKQTILCEKETDEDGNHYSSYHEACEYFVPVQGAYPKEIEAVRLLVQSLPHTIRSYFRWALAQSYALVDQTDCQGQNICFGDTVSFRQNGAEYTGTVEGVDPETKAIILYAPAFPKSAISILGKSLTKLSPQKAREKVITNKALLPEAEESVINEQLEGLLKDLNTVRSNLDKNPQDVVEMYGYMAEIETIEHTLKYNEALKLLLSRF